MKHINKYFIVLLISFVVTSCDEVEKEFYSTGELKTEIEYSDESKQSGSCKEYYESGKLKAEYKFISDKKDGVVKWYFENGNLNTEANYTNGVVNGSLKEYYEDGKLKAKGVMENGMENGLSQVWYNSGQMLREAEFEMGMKNGYFKEYFEDGNLAMDALYEKDTAIFYKKFNKDGSLEKEYRLLSLIQSKDTVAIGEELELKLKLFGPELKYKYEVQIVVDALYEIEPFVETVEKETLELGKGGELIYTLKVPNKVGHYGLSVTSWYKNGEIKPTNAWFKTSGGFYVVESDELIN